MTRFELECTEKIQRGKVRQTCEDCKGEGWLPVDSYSHRITKHGLMTYANSMTQPCMRCGTRGWIEG